MSKPKTRPVSPYARDAVAHLGQLIRRARTERKLTAAELAERAGISRALLYRIEKGDPGCAIGAAFEAAAIAGVPLFDADRTALAAHVSANRTIVSLLPQAVRPHRSEPKDDF